MMTQLLLVDVWQYLVPYACNLHVLFAVSVSYGRRLINSFSQHCGCCCSKSFMLFFIKFVTFVCEQLKIKHIGRATHWS